MRRMGGKVHGRDVLVPMLDIHTVAAGGGTLAWIDASGVLQVGPAERGRDSGTGVLRHGGTRADDHRREPRARLPERRTTRLPAARCARPRRGRDARSARRSPIRWASR